MGLNTSGDIFCPPEDGFEFWRSRRALANHVGSSISSAPMSSKDRTIIQPVRVGGLLEAAEGASFDLADTFARHPQLLAHFLKRVNAAIRKSVTLLDDASLAGRKRLEDLFQRFT